MPATKPSRTRVQLTALVSASALLLFGGCATTQVGTQYADPQFTAQALRGASILVVCEAPETALKLICEQELSGQLAGLGAKPLTDPRLGNSMPGRDPREGDYLAAAQAAGARAVFSASLTPDAWSASPPPWLSIGIGGWNWSGVSGGVGVSMPVGGAQVGMGLAAVATLHEAASGRVMWSGSATTPAAEARQQISELAKVLAEAVRQTGLF